MYNRIKDADADKSGSISVKELFGVIKAAANSDRLKKLFQRLFGVSLVVIAILIGAMLGMGMISGEMVKESHVPNCADPQADDRALALSPPERPCAHDAPTPAPSPDRLRVWPPRLTFDRARGAACFASARCNPANLVMTGSPESYVESIFELPAVPTQQLAHLKQITMCTPVPRARQPTSASRASVACLVRPCVPAGFSRCALACAP